MMKESSKVREKSSFRKVGASDGGSDEAAIVRQPERQADQGDGEDADQRAADDLAVVQRRDQHEAEQAQDRRPLLEVAERDQRRRMRHHDLRLLERDDAEEQPDAGRDREL